MASTRELLIRRRREDDDDIMLFLLPSLLSSSRREKTPRHTSSRTGKVLMQDDDDDDDVMILQPSMEQVTSDGAVESSAFLSNYNQHDIDDDDNLTILPAADISSRDTRPAAESSSRDRRPAAESSSRDRRPGAESSSRDRRLAAESSSRDKRPAAEREGPAASGAKRGKRKVGDVAEMMGQYLALKTKQTEEDIAEQQKARAKAEASDFSIRNCITILTTMEELSTEERADAYDVFTDPQNREIFMTAEPPSRLIWLRRKIRMINSSI